MKSLSKCSAAIIDAYDQGYRVDEGGKLINISGRKLQKRKSFNSIYRKAAVGSGKAYLTFYIHRLAAYQKFGKKMFRDGIVVRHLNGISTDNSLDNIAIGTESQNMRDIPAEKRRASAIAGAEKFRTPDKVVCKIGEDQQSGLTRKQLSKKYNLTVPSLEGILKRYRAEVLGLTPGPAISDDDVRAIRKQYETGGYSQKEVASKFGVQQVTISNVIRRKHYKHII